MNNYFLTLVFRDGLEDKARDQLVAEIKGKLKTDSAKATSLKEDVWGSRDLAYPIKRQTKGYYVHFEFETDPKVAKTLDNTLRVEDDILRYLLVRR